jgi:hypothetical protein
MNIHQIWQGTDIPERISNLLATWSSLPDTNYKLWRDEDLAVYNDFLIEADLDTLHPAYKSYLYRLLILQDFGGLYIDADCEKIGDIPVLDKFTMVCEKGILKNTVMFAPSGDPLLHNIIYFGINGAGTEEVVGAKFGSVALQRIFGMEYQDTYNRIEYDTWCRHYNFKTWRSYPGTKYNVRESKTLTRKIGPV